MQIEQAHRDEGQSQTITPAVQIRGFFGGPAKAAPQKGGTLRIGMADGAVSDNWDPAVTDTRYMIQMNHVNRNCLTEITSDNKLGPEQAKSWARPRTR